MKKFLSLLLIGVLSLVLASCNDAKTEQKEEKTKTPEVTQPVKTPEETKPATPTPEPTEPVETPEPTEPETPQPTEVEPSVEAKDFVATREDNREEVYEHYSYDGELIDTFTSLYAAINSCVNEGDINDYVLQRDSEEKLFVNYQEYSEASKDMYWYYNEGNSLSKYTMWEKSYWSDLRDTDNITVFKAAENGTITHYYNGYKTIATTTDKLVPFYNQVQAWHVCSEIETSATVDMIAYSGITKSEYTIKLSEARITPAYDGGDTAYAYVGFITADAFNTSNIGIKCDTTTGNWYYYSGEASMNASSIVMEEEECYLTSTWNEEGGYFTPDSDVIMTMELLTLEDEDGDSYIVHRLTMDFGNGRVVVKDYEISSLTQCGSIRFTCGIDIESDNTLVDYMCGAEFENIVITSAIATMPEEMGDDSVYGAFPELFPGVYDILNSNPQSDARFHTILYTPSCVTYDFSTPGKDVYGFSFDINPAYVG